MHEMGKIKPFGCHCVDRQAQNFDYAENFAFISELLEQIILHRVFWQFKSLNSRRDCAACC